MSNNDYILNLLNIEDKNINILSNNIISKNINGKTTKIIEGILTYKPDFCPVCGTINESSNDIIKWDFKKNCKVKIPKISNCNSLLILHKQRFYCKHCHNTFIASTSLVDRFKNISNNSNLQIRLKLMKKISEKDIADDVNVSTSSVNRIMDYISSNTVLRHEHLPSSMNFDEFKATKDTSGYISLSEKLFKNAKIVIDRFHIVTQVYNALNITRVKLCHKSNPNYNKLKHYWKLIVKNEFELSDKKLYSSHFKKYISQKEIVSYLINTDSTLKATYEYYQGIINSIKDKDFNKFKNIIHHPNYLISDKMKQALKLYRQYEKYIENSFIYDINNGVIEGTNNLIKCVKRIAFGYKKFKHLSTRVLLIKGIIKEG